MIRFNECLQIGNEFEYMKKAVENFKICGDGDFTHKCCRWFEEKCGVPKALLTSSCTHAIDMMALLCDIKEGDEIIMPSFNFVSGANAFVLRKAKIVFVDIRPDTMNIDEGKIEEAITDKTKVILPVHYAGVSCEMDTIMDIAQKYNLKVLEDAAQGMMSTYKGNPLGSIGDFGSYSFHETKNYTMGEGGVLFVNDPEKIEEAEILREKGTDRSKFYRGQVDKYTWVSVGSSYLPSDISAAYLWAQLEKADEINAKRLSLYSLYYGQLKSLQERGVIQLPFVPEHCEHNGHIFYVKLKDLEERTSLIEFLKTNAINAVFHYIPLHSSPAGKKYGRFVGQDKFTTKESERLLRLPMHYNLTFEDVEAVSSCIKEFYKNK